eukprot:GHVN01075294.1.p1 GENE.GHVN01075294.1~~GHVN01075294.1.p1  ORF type:complete len:481 (+),score=60.60 GHVN01075294.1:168-1610(+)
MATHHVSSQRWASVQSVNHLEKKETMKVARQDPMDAANLARQKKEADMRQTNVGEEGGEPRSSLDRASSIVRGTAPEWHPVSSETHTRSHSKSPTTALMSSESTMGRLLRAGTQNAHAHHRLEPKATKIIDHVGGDPTRKAAVKIEGYLVVTCPKQFRHFNTTRKVVVLVDGVLRAVDISANWSLHRFCFARHLQNGEVRTRDLWMGGIDSCNDSPDDIRHVLALGSVSDVWDFSQKHICVMGLRSGQRPILFVFESIPEKEDFIILCQHINYYFLTRMSAYVDALKESDGNINEYRDVSLKTVMLTYARQEPCFKENLKSFAEFVRGVPCQVIYGNRIATDAKIRIVFDDAGVFLEFGNLGREVLPIRDMLVTYDDEAKRKFARTRAHLKTPPFTQKYSHKYMSSNDIASLNNWVSCHPAEWPSSIFITFFSSKKVKQFEGTLNLIEKSLTSVSDDTGSYQDIFSAPIPEEDAESVDMS